MGLRPKVNLIMGVKNFYNLPDNWDEINIKLPKIVKCDPLVEKVSDEVIEKNNKAATIRHYLENKLIDDVLHVGRDEHEDLNGLVGFIIDELPYSNLVLWAMASANPDLAQDNVQIVTEGANCLFNEFELKQWKMVACSLLNQLGAMVTPEDLELMIAWTWR